MYHPLIEKHTGLRTAWLSTKEQESVKLYLSVFPLIYGTLVVVHLLPSHSYFKAKRQTAHTSPSPIYTQQPDSDNKNIASTDREFIHIRHTTLATPLKNRACVEVPRRQLEANDNAFSSTLNRH